MGSAVCAQIAAMLTPPTEAHHFRSLWGAWHTIRGYEAIHVIRKDSPLEVIVLLFIAHTSAAIAVESRDILSTALRSSPLTERQ